MSILFLYRLFLMLSGAQILLTIIHLAIGDFGEAAGLFFSAAFGGWFGWTGIDAVAQQGKQEGEA